MKLLVKDCVNTQIEPLNTHMMLTEAVEKLLDSGLTGLPVIDDQSQLKGFLSEQDCLQQLLKDSYHCDDLTLVSDLMHKEPLAVDINDSIIELAQTMTGNKPKVYPVLEDGVLIGIVTRRDIMTALNSELQNCQKVV
ncbi:Hypoxic response protein 1 [invertebrate metagenome]|uniref:Hypoxic response protein 1 n=1 Tax=invertebrate metagenome TaxID=1711999 RepID=A0A2H9T9K6_9ZZZZ